MAEQKACTVFQARESKSFNLRVNFTATKHLSGDECIDIDVHVPPAAGFTCTAKYWPNWQSSGCIKISVVITCTDDPNHRQRHKLLAAHIGLPARTSLTPPTVISLTPPTVTVGRETVTTPCNCNEGSMVKQETITPDCKEAMVKREPVTTTTTVDCCKEGIFLLAKRSDVEASCVVDDHFTAICMVAVSKFWPPLPLPTLPRLELDILKAADDLTDVSCQVDGETIRAHRLVLAARSPVFRAELSGQTAADDGDQGQQQQQQEQQEKAPASSTTDAIIKIQDMKASTFRSMLHYMYHGVLPAEADCRPPEFQNLYVAADRYGLDALRQTCEEVLCASVTTGTVLSILQFAEERACPKLKSRCLDFLAVGEKFKAVAVTNEYIDLMKKVPSLLDHVQNRFKRPRLSSTGLPN